MRTARARRSAAVSVLALAAIAACSDSVTAPVAPAPADAISQIVSQIYLPTLDSIFVRAARLDTAIVALVGAPSSVTLQTAQDAWRATRVEYERNEGFAFGPLVTGGYDPAMDTWPVDVAGIDALLASGAPLDRASIDVLDGTLKGFHGLEYILFGLNGGTTPDALTPRDLAYLTGAGASLANEAAGLHSAWATSGGNYAAQLLHSGTSQSVYVSTAAALQEIVGGIIDPVDEVASSKIGLPLQTGSSEYEESRFSDHTIIDLHNNINGAYRVYLGGDSGTVGSGISSLIAAQNPAVDRTVRQQFDAALSALNAIGPSFDATLHTHPELLRAAQQALLRLEQTLTLRVVPLTGAAADPD
ncbi:MAG TPA: imelysin family protein [Gemmatimonadaceae bacterium]